MTAYGHMVHLTENGEQMINQSPHIALVEVCQEHEQSPECMNSTMEKAPFSSYLVSGQKSSLHKQSIVV